MRSFPRPRLAIPRGAAAVWSLTALFAGLAVALWLHLPDTAPEAASRTIPLWVLVLAFAAAESAVVHVRLRKSAFVLTFGELPVVVALLFSAPSHLAVAWTVGVGIVLLIARVPPIRIAFNLAELSLTSGGAAILFAALGGRTGELGPSTWAAAAVATLSAAVVSSALIALAMVVWGERVPVTRVRGMLLTAAGAAATNICLGLALAVVLDADARAVPLLLVPAAAVLVAYRAYQHEREKTLGLEFLAQAHEKLERGEHAEAGLAGVLALSVETFRSEMAEALILPASGEGAGRRVAVGAGGAIEIDHDISEALVADVEAAVGEDPAPRIVTPDDLGPALAEHLRSKNVDAAMIAGLPGDAHLVGAVLVANRFGVGATFEAHDLRLLGMLGTHTGTTLGQERLEQRVTAMRATNDHLFHQAFHDPLTGLANRALFADRVDHAMKRREGNATVIYIDLDDFKPVNDTYGHDAGDALLVATAERMRESLRAADTPARLGGDEFAVLITDVDPVDVQTVTERILRNLAAPCDIGDASVPIKASVGVATADSGSMTGADLIRDSDAAMYVCKHGGKGGYSVAGAAVAPAAPA